MPIDSKLLSINDFLARTAETGFARANRLTVSVFGPFNTINEARSMTYSAEQVSLPGRMLEVSSVNIYGPVFKMPRLSTYNDILITFLCDDYMTQRTAFDKWINYINPTQNGFNFNYRDDYVGRLEIRQINESGTKASYGVKLIEAYPIAIGGIQGNWVETDIQRLQVQFAYRYWENLTPLEL